MEHALSCTRGGFPTLRHNEVRDLTASMLSEVCLNVSIEPALQELRGETLSGSSSNRNCGARVDVAADGFGGHGRKRTFLDIRVLILSLPQTNRPLFQPPTDHTKRVKKRQYCERICETEHGTFSPLFSP